MPDIMIRHIDRLMAERIKALAKERAWSVNDVLLNALRQGLGVSESASAYAETSRESSDLGGGGGQFDASEKAAFQEAMQALAVARAEQLAPTNRAANDYE